MKNSQNNEAVSEILGTVFLLAIAVTSVSIIFIQVLGLLTPIETNNVTIIDPPPKFHLASKFPYPPKFDEIEKLQMVTATLSGF